MIDKDERNREVEKRERLIQTFLIISGFLVAFTRGESQRFIVLIFSMYLIVTILYYIFLPRTRIYPTTDFLALFSSWYYSLLILTFLGLQLTNGFISWHFWFLFIILTAIFTFSLLSPDTCGRIVNWFEKFSMKQEEKPQKLLKVILNIMFIIVVIGSILVSIIVTIMVHNILV